MTEQRKNDLQLFKDILELVKSHSKKQEGNRVLSCIRFEVSKDLKIEGFKATWKFKKGDWETKEVEL